MPVAIDTYTTGAAPRIAVVTTDESVQLAAQEVLASAFHTTLLDSGEQVLPLLAEATVEAVVLDLETAHASDDQMLRLVRQLREHDEDLVLLGFTRSHNKTSRRQFEQAGIGIVSSRPSISRKYRQRSGPPSGNGPRKSRTASCARRPASEIRFAS